MTSADIVNARILLSPAVRINLDNVYKEWIYALCEVTVYGKSMAGRCKGFHVEFRASHFQVTPSRAPKIMSELLKRPRGVSTLSIFFLAGALISLTAGASLLFPGSFIEPMWRVNPRAFKHLSDLGPWAAVLLFAVSVSCAMAAIGLWRRAAWGYKIAVGLIAINLIADVANTVMGTEPRAIVGVPIALAILIYLLSKKVRDSFS